MSICKEDLGKLHKGKVGQLKFSRLESKINELKALLIEPTEYGQRQNYWQSRGDKADKPLSPTVNNTESNRYDQRQSSMYISTSDITSEFDLFYLKLQCVSFKQANSFQVSC